MNTINILDCTLRDGGYCNNWNFGRKNISKILEGIAAAEIDIIECGYLTNRGSSYSESTLFTDIDEVNDYLKKVNIHQDTIYTLMVNFGEYDVNDIPMYSGGGVKGIRVAFHKKDATRAVEFCRQLKEKGYYVFVQPMVTISYSDKEIVELIESVNRIRPYAFYIVDSFGMMKYKDLNRLFTIAERNLVEGVLIGFHSHNNLQLAFSNSQRLVETLTKRNLIIDTSIFGMGRGAGNLNTELFVEYLNDIKGTNYKISPLLNVIDEVLNDFFMKNPWGYSLPYYLSAKNNVHPNYAMYFSEKNTLTFEAMDKMLASIETEKKIKYDKDYANDIYSRYMNGQNAGSNIEKVAEQIRGRKILLVGPGKTFETEKEKILKAIDSDTISVGINSDFGLTDYIFVSNLIRYRDLPKECYLKCITTSNIQACDCLAEISYEELLVTQESVKDNAGLMAIKLMIKLGAKEIKLAGFDGYSHTFEENYGSTARAFTAKSVTIDAMNEAIEQNIKIFSKQIRIEFITDTLYRI